MILAENHSLLARSIKRTEKSSGGGIEGEYWQEARTRTRRYYGNPLSEPRLGSGPFSSGGSQGYCDIGLQPMPRFNPHY